MVMHWNLLKADPVMKNISINLTSLFVLLVSLCGLAVAGGNAPDDEFPVITTIVEDADYKEILEAVKESIKGKGINIAHTLPSADMLGRTGPTFGISDAILKNGEMVEFCSAKISHQLIQANIQNIVLCPFNIAVYELNANPGKVYITFRKPYVIDQASVESTRAMVELMTEIVEEAASW
jgi:uncharacterized protein (DUF302 family)